MTSEPKVACETPTPGKRAVNVPRWKYDAVRSAILKVVPTREPGLLFQELPKLVDQQLSTDVRSRLGSVAWHTTVVKLHMEVLGELRRIDGHSPQRLLRT